MNETTHLLKTSEPHILEGTMDDGKYWGGTPELRKLWASNNKSFKPRVDDEKNEKRSMSFDADKELGLSSFMIDKLESPLPKPTAPEQHKSVEKLQSAISSGLMGAPGLIIALVLNLFLSMSFGQAFFPTNWVFPPEVPRAIGVQMFLFSTFICQLVMTAFSEFPTAMGMMMVENIPFMHIIAQIAVKAQGPGLATFSTVFVTFALSTVVVGIAFLILGAFKIGNAVYFFPRHVIIGCIGGIGIFIFQTGVEVSCDRAWEWTAPSIAAFFQTPLLWHWLASLGFVIVLRILLAVLNAPLLPPFYFVAIPPAFYLILLLCGVSQEEAHAQNWFFPQAENVDPLLIWKLIDVGKVDWGVVSDCIPTIIALSVFRQDHLASLHIDCML